MSTHVRIERLGARTLACKRATSPAGIDRVRDEAVRLSAIDHPGVVRFIELRDTEDGPELVTEYVGPRTLASCGPLTTDRAADLVADLASTVADLHARGLVHGALRPEHVLLAGDRTVLCGFASADGTPADDVHGIGAVLRSLLDPEVEEEPIPDRRIWRRVPWNGYRHRALLTLADQATADEPGRRPAARALAHAVHEAAGHPPPGRTEPDRSAPGRIEALRDLVAVHTRRHRREGPRRLRPPGRVAVLGTTGLALAVLGLLGTTGDTSPAATSPSPTAPPDTACPAVTGRLADVDGDGCPEGVRQGPGWIEVAGTRYRLGRPGDAVELGDWDCDGRDTVALLQPLVGDVWRFSAWDPDAAITADPAGHYAGATGLDRRQGPTCDALLVRHEDGRLTEVPRG